MGAKQTRRSMTPIQQEEEAVAAVVDAAVDELPPIEDEGAASNAVDEIISRTDLRVRELLPRQLEKLPLPPASVVVRLDGLEVTQEIQDMEHSVPLVAGKQTIVRAYLSRSGPSVTVRGELRVSRSPFGPWTTVPSIGTAALSASRSGTKLEDLRSRRANLHYSLNFRLPSEVVNRPGRLYLRLGKLRRARGNAAVPSVAHVRRHVRTLRPGVPLRLRLIRFSYTMNQTTHTPTATDVAHLRSYLRRTYPVNRVLMSTRTVTANAAPPFEATDINAQLQAIRAVDVATGTDARTYYYGMVHNGGFFMRGRAAGIPATAQPQTVSSGPTGSTGFAWDTDGSWGDWYGAHEIAHTLGRFHAEFCGAGGGRPYPFANGQLSDADEAFVGLDVGDPTLGLPLRVWHPTTSHDVMTYCEYQWLSSFTYEGIYDRLVATEALSSGATTGAAAEAAGHAEAAGAEPGSADGGSSSMRIFAAINLDRHEGSISAVLPADLVGPAEVQDAGAAAGSADVRARVIGADGTVLDERSVRFVPSVCEDPDQDVTGTVDADLPELSGAALVQLLVEGEVVAEHAVGGAPAAPSAPRASDTAVAGLLHSENEQVRGDVVHLSWDAVDAPASQRYLVQVSQEEGVWETVAIDLAEPGLDLPIEGFDGDEIAVRVLATTGVGTVEIQSDRISLG